MNESTQSIHAALLPFLGVLRFHGEDAARFLQGQVTQDTSLLAEGRTLLTACNTASGFGRDVSNGGRAIERTADQAK